jgi:hypothetical protein
MCGRVRDTDGALADFALNKKSDPIDGALYQEALEILG